MSSSALSFIGRLLSKGSGVIGRGLVKGASALSRGLAKGLSFLRGPAISKALARGSTIAGKLSQAAVKAAPVIAGVGTGIGIAKDVGIIKGETADKLSSRVGKASDFASKGSSGLSSLQKNLAEAARRSSGGVI